MMPSSRIRRRSQPPTRPSTRSFHDLEPRFEEEHVVLADCKRPDGTYLSQMAYFRYAPNGKPLDTSTVKTQSGGHAVWPGRTTEGLFTSTNTRFVAKIGPQVAEGQYAGTGNNGYEGEFSCWQIYKPDSYKFDDIICSQVYDCDRRPKPANLPTPLPAPSPTPTPGANNTTSATDTTNSGPGELSIGALIAIVIGGVTAFLIALIAGFLIFRALRRDRNEPDKFLDFFGRCCCGMGRRNVAELHANEIRTADQDTYRSSRTIYEMDASYVPELYAGQPLPHELGGKESPRVIAELESPILKTPFASILARTRQWSWFPGDDKARQRPDEGEGRRSRKGSKAELPG